MASPQTEDGHVEIANDLWDALMGAGLNKNEYRALLCILRYSYGVKEKYAKLKKIEISKITRIPLPKVNETLTTLEKKNIVRLSKSNGYIYFHKDYEKWQLNETLTFDGKWKAQVNETLTKNLPKRKVLGSRNVKSQPRRLSSRITSKDSKKSIKESIKESTIIMSQIDNLLSQFPPDIQELTEEYVELVRIGNKTQRIASRKKKRLIAELFHEWSNCDSDLLREDFKSALRTTISNEAPHINYVRKVMKGNIRRRKIRLKKGAERDAHN